MLINQLLICLRLKDLTNQKHRLTNQNTDIYLVIVDLPLHLSDIFPRLLEHLRSARLVSFQCWNTVLRRVNQSEPPVTIDQSEALPAVLESYP